MNSRDSALRRWPAITAVVTLLLGLGATSSCSPMKRRAPVPPKSYPALSVPRLALHAVRVEDEVHVIGGASRESEGTAHERLRIGEAEWTRLADLPVPRMFSGAVAHDGKVYAFGGVSADSSAAVYDPKTERWGALPDLPTPRNRLRAVSLGDRIYVIGGMDGSSGTLTDVATVESFHPPTQTWRTEPSLNHPRHGHACVQIGDSIAVVGGSEMRGSVEIFDPAAGAWQERRALGSRLLFHEAAAVGSHIYIFGNRADPPIPLYRYDASADSWATIDGHSVSRHRAASVVVGDLILVIGGENNVGSPHVLRDVVVYDTAAGEWFGDRGSMQSEE